MTSPPVPGEEAGERLDKWLSVRCGLSRSSLARLMAQGHVSLAGEIITDPARKVKPGQVFVVIEPPPGDLPLVPEDIPLEILYEDADLLVVNKPAGLVVHPGAGHGAGTLVHALLAHCGDSLSGIGGVKRPGIVHRLDKETSGVLVAAKSDAAHAGLSAQFKEHSVHREYRAVTWGRPKPPEGTVETLIGRDPKNRQKMAVLPASSRAGRRAATAYAVLESAEGGAASLVACRLLTGRTHQVRVHMAHLQAPLIGDPLYGGRARLPQKALPPETYAALRSFPRQALHAAALGFVHPVTGAPLLFRTELPDDMKNLLRLLFEI